MSAASAADALICDGRNAISFGNSLNFAGTGRGPKILRSTAGHISRPINGAIVNLATSPSTGIAGPDIMITSVLGSG